MHVEQFVMAYGVEQDRVRAILPDGFSSLRPVLRINAEIQNYDVGYIEFNTAVEKDGNRGWLNIGCWNNVPFERTGKTVKFKTEMLEIAYTGVGVEGSCPAEKDNAGCYFISDTEFYLRKTEAISANKEFCDCEFRWTFSEGAAHGKSVGKTLPAIPTEIVTIYPKEKFTVENAAKIPCEQVLGTYFVAFEREEQMKKAIFWDCDGTLVRDNESFKCSLLRALREFGYSIEEEEVKRFLRETCSWNKPEEDHWDENGEEWWERLLGGMRMFCEEQGVSPADAGYVCSAFRKNVVSYEYEVYPDTKKVLRYFSEKGYKHYIISNNFPELREVFIRLGLDDEISGYFISASVGYDKPRKEIYEYAIANAGNPEIRYMIGDNPAADYEGSLNAGMKSVLVHKNVEGKVCCEQLTDLFDIIAE